MGERSRWIIGVVVLGLVLSCLGPAGADEKEAEAAARREAMLEAGRTRFCRTHYYFKRPEDEKLSGVDMFMFDAEQFTRFQYDHFIDRQMSLLMVGLLLDEAGHVLVGDMHFEDKYIDRIEVEAPDGTRYPAVRAKLLDRAPAVLLKITEPLENWEVRGFVEQDRIEDPARVFAVSLRRTGRRWWLSLERMGAEFAYEGAGDTSDRLSGHSASSFFGISTGEELFNPFAMFDGSRRGGLMAVSRQPSLLCNERGEPIGAALSGLPLDCRQEEADWQHERLLNGPGLTFAELSELVEKCREELAGKIYKCRLLYRLTGGESRGFDFGAILERSMRMGMGIGEDAGKERTTFALAVSPTRLIVPYSIGREEAAKIEKIEITVADKTLEAELVGAFQEIGAFLVDLKEGMLPAATALTQKERPDRMRLFLTATAEEKFGKKHLKVQPNRWLREARGYKNGYYISPVHALPQGTWLLNKSLEVIGLYARQRTEGEELRGFASGGMPMFMMSELTGGHARVFWTPELSELLADPIAHFDPQIRHKTEEEAKRTVWLGVEYISLGRELAKQLNVEKESKDGTIGLYVNLIYKNSPAEKMGIKNGDILLRIETRKRPDPIELSAHRGEFDFFSFDWEDFMDYRYVEEYGGAKPRWPLRCNYLTMMLRTIGVGEKVELTYLHEGKLETKELVIQQAPRDFTSAKKFKHKEVGLTIKDLTYEVRAGLRLGDDKQAVVVAKVEPGSPAKVAKIMPFELITAVEGTSVGSAEEFGERIKKALTEKRESLRLTIDRLGKTRLADLDLSQIEEGASE